MKPRTSFWRWFVMLLILIYPFIWVWQGLDFTDTGFAMSNYNLIFTAPHTIHYWGFNYWLTDVVGGAWLLVFGKLGLFGIRLFSALLMIGTNALVYRLYRTWIPSIPLLISMLVGETFIERMYWLNYDNLSAFLFAVSGFLLIQGIIKHRVGHTFFAGVIFGLNVFARVTNLAGLVILLAILLSALASKPFSLRKPLLQAFSFLIGAVGAMAIVLLTMKLSGQLTDFGDNLSTLLNIAGGHGNTHSSSNLLKQFSQNQGLAVQSALDGFVFFIYLTIGHALLGRLKSRLALHAFHALSVTGLVIAFYPLLTDRYHFVAGLTGILYALLALAIVIGIRRQDIRLTATGSTALLILFAIPLGSDLGIRLAVYGMYLALPLAAHLAWDLLPKTLVFKRLRWTTDGLRSALVFLGLGLFSLGVVTGYQYTYRDTSARMSMTVPLANPKLKFVYTTADRALVVNQLFAALPKYVQQGEPLMAYEETSLVYYVTNTRPYLNTSWPMLYDPARFQAALQQAVQTHRYLPVVVRAKAATADFNWPNVSHLRLDYRHNQDRNMMDWFLKDHRYHVAWQNSFFQILIPPQVASK